MNVAPDDRTLREPAPSAAAPGRVAEFASRSLAGGNAEPIRILALNEPEPQLGEPGTVILTCANCGAEMIERKCKLICRCGYFLSCSDYY